VSPQSDISPRYWIFNTEHVMISFLYQHSTGGLNYAKAEYLCSENSDDI